MKRLLIALVAAALLVCGTASALASQFGGTLPDINSSEVKRGQSAAPLSPLPRL
jgi:hypothetical protein